MMNKKELQKFFYEDNINLIGKNEDEMFEKIKQRVTYLPSKLYKFRFGYARDLRVLKQNKVWFSKPDDCDDPMDTILNINFQKDLPYFKGFLQENFIAFVKYFILKLCPAMANVLTDDMIKMIMDKCYDSSGNLKQEEALHFYKEQNPNLSDPIIKKSLSFIDPLNNIQDHIPKEILTSFEKEWRCVLPYAEKTNLQKFFKVKAVYIRL